MIKLKESLARTAQSARDARSEKIKQAISTIVEEIKNSIITNLQLSAQEGYNELKYNLHIDSWGKVAPYLCNLDNDAIAEVCSKSVAETIAWLRDTDLELVINQDHSKSVVFIAKW